MDRGGKWVVDIQNFDEVAATRNFDFQETHALYILGEGKTGVASFSQHTSAYGIPGTGEVQGKEGRC